MRSSISLSSGRSRSEIRSDVLSGRVIPSVEDISRLVE